MNARPINLVPESESVVRSFQALVADGCRVLILGSMPGKRSLEQNQYYAHPRNLFWPLMGELYHVGHELPYAERIRALQQRHVGIWDVLAECDRPGSLDGSINAETEIPNDIAALLSRHPGINVIALNGGKAQQGFRRYIEPVLDATTRARLRVLSMPSTSAANAGIPLAIKRAQWQRLIDKG